MDESLDHVPNPTDQTPAVSGAPEESPKNATSSPPETGEVKTLHRSATKKLFGGVAGGIAERFDIDANIVRVVFLVISLVYGLGIAIYLAMWVLIPSASSNEPVETPEESVHRIRWLRFALPLGAVIFAAIAIATLHGGHRGLFVGKGLSLIWLVFLIVLAVVALGAPAMRLTFRRLVALAFLGLLSLLIVLSGVFFLIVSLTGVPMRGGNGVQSWQPLSVAQVRHTYRGSIGESEVDLSRVDFVGSYSITVTEAVGQVIVTVPRNAVINLRTDVGIGHAWRQFGAAVATPGRVSPVLNLNLKVGVGRLYVVRGYRAPLRAAPTVPSVPAVTTTTG